MSPTAKWTLLLVLQCFVWLIGTVLLIPIVYNKGVDFVLRANINYWWFWINFYINTRITVKLLLPLMEKHVEMDKPGYLDPHIERLKAWLRKRILYAGGKDTTFAE